MLAPLVRDRKTEGDRIFDQIRRQGFVRVRVDGVLLDLSETVALDKYKRHTIEAVVDRFVVRRPEVPAGADVRSTTTVGRSTPRRASRCATRTPPAWPTRSRRPFVSARASS